MAPGFFGFFSKRDSSKTLRKATSSSSPRPRPKSPAKGQTSPSIADNSENLEGSQLSLETDYVLADPDSPPLPSTAAHLLASTPGASSSTTKIKMPFRRKQSTSSKFSATATQSSAPPVPPAKEHHKASIESSLSDTPSLRPPPSRSVIFGSYADPQNTLSTRSLPQDSPFTHSRHDSADTARNYETMSNPDSHMPSYSPLQPPKPPSKGGLFAWARPRGRTKSKAAVPTPPSLPSRSSSALVPPASDSFNLKSFRHVTSSLSTSPNPDPPPSDSLDPPVRPRPRGDSLASDSSQRISVAAFREAQARRSATNSPVPSIPGDRDSGPASGQVRSRKRSSTLGIPPPFPTTVSQHRLSVARGPPTRSSTAPLFLSAGTTSSESSEEGESDSDEEEEEATLRPIRKRTVTSRSTGGTQSELGHRTSPVAAFSSARSDVGHGVHSGSPSQTAPSPQYSPNLEAAGRTSRTSSVYSRTRASVSASALVPDAAAKRASMISKQSVASKQTQPTRTQSRASTSSEEESSSSSSSSLSSSEDAPLASLLPPPRPGSAMSRASGSPARRPTKPLIDIGELVGGNAPPIRTPEQSRDSSQVASKEDSPLMRPRKTSFGIGERLSALASGISGSQPSRPKSPESASDSKDEAFTPPAVLDRPRPQSPALSTGTSPPPRSQTKSASPALKLKGAKSSTGIRLKSSGGFQIDTSPLKTDPAFPPPPSSSASSDAPIPHITPTPIRERQEPPAFTVTSRPTSHATNPSVGTLAALDKAIAESNSKQGPRPAASAPADRTRSDQQRQPQQQQQDPQATVRVVRGVPTKPSREESLPVPRPQQRPRIASAGVTVSNIRVTPPPSSASSSPSVARYGASSGPVVPLPKPFAIRDSSPASSAGESSSSRMPATPRDGSELGVGANGRLGPGHRKRVSVTFLDTVEVNERDARRSSVAVRPSHGPVVAADSSDDETSLRNRERKAEEKRKERRRGEAKAAIELGKVINGTGPIDDDDDDNDDEDDDDDRPMNVPPRMSMAMGMGMNRNVPFPSASAPVGFQGQWNSAGAPPRFANQVGSHSMQNLLGASAGNGAGLGGGMDMAAGMNMNLNMGVGMGMVDPRMLVAHQQAMMIAKQTYQLAVAQQAMRDAADEWERGSAISGWGGGGGRSSVGAPSVLGMGMNMNMNMNANLGANPFGMPPGAWPAGGGGSAARSMYAGSVYAASEIGVPGGGGAMGWSTTNSVYGESFGAPRDRSSRAFRQGQTPQHGPGGASAAARESGGGASGTARREGARQRTKTAPSSGGGQQSRASAGAGAGAGAKRRGEAPGLVGAVSPPSSWRGHS